VLKENKNKNKLTSASERKQKFFIIFYQSKYLQINCQCVCVKRLLYICEKEHE